MASVTLTAADTQCLVATISAISGVGSQYIQVLTSTFISASRRLLSGSTVSLTYSITYQSGTAVTSSTIMAKLTASVADSTFTSELQAVAATLQV